VDTDRSDGRVVIAKHATLGEFARSFDQVAWSAPTDDDVSRMKLDGPPATPTQIAAAFGQPPTR